VNPRIESAQILSYRLKVPPAELRQLPDQVGKGLKLSVEVDGVELVVTVEEGDSYLRFKPIGHDAMLTEIFLSKDDQGLFFLRVVGPLSVRADGCSESSPVASCWCE
jgi:hypothetical protein